MVAQNRSRQAFESYLTPFGLEGLGGDFGDSLIALVHAARRAWGRADSKNADALRVMTVAQLLYAYEAEQYGKAGCGQVPGLQK